MISFLQHLGRARRPVVNLDFRATKMHERLAEVVSALATLVPEPGALDRALINLAQAENPWEDKPNLANLTEVAARLNFAVELLTGFIGEHDLAVTDAREFSIAAVERGLLPPVSAACDSLARRERRRRLRAGA